MYSLLVQKARSLKSRCHHNHTSSEGSKGAPSLPFPASGDARLPLAYGSCNLNICFHSHIAFSSVCPSLSFFLYNICHSILNPLQCTMISSQDPYLNYICKDSFRNKITFTGSRWTYHYMRRKSIIQYITEIYSKIGF